MRPVETPAAPCFIAALTMPCIFDELVGRGRPVVVADDQLSHRAQADVGQQVHRDALLLEHGEVAAEVGPRLIGGGRGLRRDRARLADDLGGHALTDLALRVAVGDERHVRVRVRVDESGRHDAALGVDDAGGPAGRRGGAGRVEHLDDASAGDGHRAVAGRRPGAVDHAGVGHEQIDRRRRWPRLTAGEPGDREQGAGKGGEWARERHEDLPGCTRGRARRCYWKWARMASTSAEIDGTGGTMAGVTPSRRVASVAAGPTVATVVWVSRSATCSSP